MAHDPNHHDHPGALKGVAFWEQHYGQSERVWSGKVNSVVEQLVGPLAPGTALDIGCGEGGDTLWLASRGWQATGMDISPTAVERATQEVQRHGFKEQQVRFFAADLADWDTEELFDLVTLSFFQAPFEFPRASLLRKAAALVAPDGHLLVLSHAALPAYANRTEHQMPAFPTPQKELNALELDSQNWRVLKAEIADRQATAPDGTPATLADSIVFVQHTGPAEN